MIYRSVAVVANNKDEGLDIAMVEFQENGGRWTHTLLHSYQVSYSEEWKMKFDGLSDSTAVDYQFLHFRFGDLIGRELNAFIQKNGLEYQPSFITYFGITVFYQPGKMIAQLGSGATIAAVTSLPVIADLPSIDVVKGGNGKFFNDMASKLGVATSDVERDRTYKTICVALMGVLRWREEVNFNARVTGASSDSVGGCIYSR